MWWVFALMICVASGSKTTTSASLPGASVPLRGNRPNSLAGEVEVSSTQRCSVIRPVRTPPS
jgi:hypothetical protein